MFVGALKELKSACDHGQASSASDIVAEVMGFIILSQI